MSDPTKKIGDLHLEWLVRRGLEQPTLDKFGIYTATSLDGEFTPNVKGNILAFPFVQGGAVVNEKYRGPLKKFFQRKGGKRTFFNADVLSDGRLESGERKLIITEGEIDCISAAQAGFEHAVSVPDGAPPAEGEMQPLDPSTEATGKFEFLYNNRHALAKIKRFIIAVDNDAPGKRLADELVRRLRPTRCEFVTYPEGCKDLNEVLVKWGNEGVREVLFRSSPYPVQGLYRLSEYPDPGPVIRYDTGWELLDPHFKLIIPTLTVVTGIPSHGKSQFVMNMLVNWAQMYKLRAVIFSPEMDTVPHLRDRFRAMLGGAYYEADSFVENHFTFIDADMAQSTSEEERGLDWVLERATDAVLRDGIRLLVIDPWNEIEHARRRDENTDEYISRALRALKRWGKSYGVAVIVIAHPTKDVVDIRGKIRKPHLYDIHGSAHWFNKCDAGLIVHRDFETGLTEVTVAKARHKQIGTPGSVRMEFDVDTGIYGKITDATRRKQRHFKIEDAIP